jgi:hypothetical protein
VVHEETVSTEVDVENEMRRVERGVPEGSRDPGHRFG